MFSIDDDLMIKRRNIEDKNKYMSFSIKSGNHPFYHCVCLFDDEDDHNYKVVDIWSKC